MDRSDYFEKGSMTYSLVDQEIRQRLRGNIRLEVFNSFKGLKNRKPLNFKINEDEIMC